MKILIGAALMAAFMLAGGAPAQAADGPCFAGGRYCDGGNGTVTDTVTGLIWLKQVNCLPLTYWQNANELARAIGDGVCGLTDSSHPGDCRPRPSGRRRSPGPLASAVIPWRSSPTVSR